VPPDFWLSPAARVWWIGRVRYEPIDPKFFLRNRERLCKMLKPKSIVVVVANDIMPTNADGVMAFKQNADLFYLTGIEQEETVLVMMPDAVDPKQREILFVKETNEHIAVWEGQKVTKEQARERTGIERIEWSQSFESMLHSLAPQAEHVYLLTNEHLRAPVVVETRNDRFVKRCQARYPLHRYERLAPLMHRLRMTKDEVEIAQLKKACEITGAGFARVLESSSAAARAVSPTCPSSVRGRATACSTTWKTTGAARTATWFSSTWRRNTPDGTRT